MMRNRVRAGFRAAVLGCTFVAAAFAQAKVGVINSQQALLDTDELKKASAALENKYKPKQDQLAKLQSELESIQQQINSGKVSQSAAAELQVQGQRKQRDAQRLSEDTQQEFDKDRQETLNSAANKMQDVIKKLAEAKGLDVVVDASQTLYFKPAMDITAEATSAYNKANPGK